MPFKIVQDAAPVDQSHWRWSVWLDASKEELDTVKEVVWKLHPSFSPSEIRVTARKNGFRLKSSGWGEFEIHADIVRLRGKKVSLRHWLRFSEKAPKKSLSTSSKEAPPATAKIAPRQPTVFLSYTSGDARLAGLVTEKLKREHDFNVFVDVDIPAGEDLTRWVHEKITESDAVVFLLPSDSAARTYSYTGFELGLATKAGAKIIPVLRADSEIPSLLKDSKAIRISSGGSSETDAQNIAQRITDIIV